MEKGLELNKHKKILISKNNIIIEANRNLLELTGYTESELVGKTLEEASEILRIDSQVDLQDIENEITICLFTKELVAIEVTMSCKTINNGEQRRFSFKANPNDLVNEKFNLADQLGKIRGEGVAIFSVPSLILINSNQNYLNLLEPPHNKKSVSIGKNIIEIAPGYLDSEFNNIKNHVIDTGAPYYIEEIKIHSRALSESYWNITLVPILEQGIIKYLIFSLSNVTERTLNRIAIKQKNEELEGVIRNLSDEIIIFDRDFNITHSNKGIDKYFTIDTQYLENLSDIMKDEIAFDKDNKVITFEDLPFQRIGRGESISKHIIKTNNVLGETYTEVSGSPIYDKNGDVSGGVMVYVDIKDRIQTEEARLIKTQNKLLTKVVDALDLEFVRCSYPDLKILSINNNGLNILKKINNGIKSTTWPIGESCFKIYPINEEVKRKEIDFYLIDKKNYSYVDYKNYFLEGDQRFFKTINQPIFGFNNKIVEMIFITIDITDQVKARNKIEETLEMQNQLFSTISHELKTPLSLIFSASQLVEMHLKNETNKINKENICGNINTIKQNCYRFTKLINNIIDLSSIESGFYDLKFSNINIITTVEEIVDSVRVYVEQKGLSVIFDTEIEEKIIAIDVDKMERIILNLISNAVKFSPKGSTIYIGIKDKGDFIDIFVRDFGIGVDKRHLNTIFDKYKKLDNSLNRNAEGSGIGLALVKNMVDLMGGRISVESELGKGCLFKISLPAKMLEESEIINIMEQSDNRIDKVNIEFSDVYAK